MNPRSTPPRWIELIPLAVLGGSFGVLAALHPNTVSDLFSGTQAVLVTVGIVGGWILLSRFVLPRVVRSGWVRVGVLSVVSVGLALVLILPSVVDKKVVEELPSVATKPVTGPLVNAPATSTTATAPIRIASSALHGIGHDATGTAALYRQSDGSFLVGLEGIDIQPGPDYLVYVVPGAGKEQPEGGVLLDDLRGNQGTQYYPVPARTALDSGEWTVLVWCRTYAVPVAGATLT